jgi:hypothetical protein
MLLGIAAIKALSPAAYAGLIVANAAKPATAMETKFLSNSKPPIDTSAIVKISHRTATFRFTIATFDGEMNQLNEDQRKYFGLLDKKAAGRLTLWEVYQPPGGKKT